MQDSDKLIDTQRSLMPTETKQLTADEVIVRLLDLSKFSEEHADEWRNEVARDLNMLVEREIRNFGNHGLVSDYAASVLRVADRVAEFEEIENVEKENTMSDETKSASRPGLDYEIVPVCDGWQVWTPACPSGACIGSGKTKKEAIADTMINLSLISESLLNDSFKL